MNGTARFQGTALGLAFIACSCAPQNEPLASVQSRLEAEQVFARTQSLEDTGSSEFGDAVALAGDLLVVGAPADGEEGVSTRDAGRARSPA